MLWCMLWVMLLYGLCYDVDNISLKKEERVELHIRNKRLKPKQYLTENTKN